MNAYIYCADTYCEECGKKIREELTSEGKASEDPTNEHTYDSDDFPKGPFENGGGYADTPQHCGGCGIFLENPLTKEGFDYVIEKIHEHISLGHGDAEVLKEWADFYEITAEDLIDG